MSRNSSSSSNLLLAIIVILTFPLWFGLGAGLLGLIVGLFGAAIGIIAAVLGACIAVLVLPFKFFFGWGDHHFHFPFFQTGNGFVIFLLLIVAFVLLQKRKKTGKA